MKRLQSWSLPLCFLAFFAAYAVSSAHFRLLDADELTHARVALEAARQGHWFPLLLDGQPWPHKPPLMIWLAALNLKAFGPQEWALRLWPALLGALALALLLRLALDLGLGRWAAAALVLATGLSLDWLYHARFLSMDTAALACGLGALLFWRRRQDWAAGLCLAALAAFKSWFALAWALPFCLDALFEAGAKRRLYRLLLPPLLVLAAWIAASVWAYGGGFLAHAFGHELWGRVSGEGHPTSAPPTRFYFAWARAFFPLGLASGVALLGRALVQRRQTLSPELRWFWLFLGAWGLGMLAVKVTVFHYFLPWGTVATLLWAAQWQRLSRVAAALWMLSVLLLALGGRSAGLGHPWLLLGLLPALLAGAWQQGDSRWSPAWILLALLPLGLHNLVKPADPNGPLVAALPSPGPSSLQIVGRPTQAPAFYGGFTTVFHGSEQGLPQGRYLRTDGTWFEIKR